MPKLSNGYPGGLAGASPHRPNISFGRGEGHDLLYMRYYDAGIGAGQRGARLSVTTPDGSKSYSVEKVLGDPERPLSRELVRAKFERYAAPSLGENRAARIADVVLEGRLETRLSEFLSVAPLSRRSPMGTA